MSNIGAVVEFLRGVFLYWFPPKPEPSEKPWLIDREGAVYKPERRVVLKGKKQ